MAENLKSTETAEPVKRKKTAVAARATNVTRKAISRPATHAHGFMEFVREQGVVGLAVGLAIGTAATVLVKSIVDNIINPLVGAMLPGSSDLNSKFVCIGNAGTECINKLAWGVVVSNLISFMAVAAVIYFVVKGLKLDKLDKKKD